MRRAQVFVEALIVEVAADRVAEFGIQWQILQGIDKTNVQGFGGTNFGTRDSGNNIVSGSINLGSLGQGLNLGVIDGTVTHSRAWHDHQPRVSSPARWRRRPAPTSCPRPRC